MPPSDQTVLSPDAASFNCTSTGKPRADIYWINKENIVISNSTEKYILSKYTIGNCTITDPPSQCVLFSTLRILNTKAVDSGEYTCVANNVIGNYSSTTALIVNGKFSSCMDSLQVSNFIYCSYTRY